MRTPSSVAAAVLLAAAPLAAQTPLATAADTMAEVRRLVGQQKRAEAVALLTPFVKAHPRHPVAGNMLATNAFAMYATAGKADSAFPWFEQLKNRTDLTSIAGIRGLEPLHNDPRYTDLFPDKIRYSPAFVEPDVRIIHEWRGESAADEFGWIARGIGDADKDGVTDVTISATSNPPFGNGRGIVYLYSGKSGKLLWKHLGDSSAALGIGLEAAGDVNGDGVPDVVAGAPGLNAVLVLSGKDGKELLRLRGDSADVNLGSAAAGIGDVDRDGRPDIAGGAPGNASAGAFTGRVIVFSGRDGHRLFTLSGERAGDGFGSTVGGGGGTLIVGAPGGGPRTTGRIYVYRGLTGTPAFTQDSDSTGAALGAMFVSMIGDVDGDGVSDVWATDYPNTARGRSTGRGYVYSGKTGAVVLTLTGEAAGEGFGIGPAKVGDLDGDHHDDLVVGGWQYSGAAWSGGRIQVFSGATGKVLQTFTGKVPGETLGFDAVGVGDIDGDGATDFLVTSAYSMVNGFRSGRVFVLAGKTRPR